ncbi:(3S)-malyl-CoA thioesterase [Hasllibacter halocynthiae]|uniref:(3S)-malyl-CoA thioesterase n=1 Tax=Hasllibacter halocynthiae TaxID=595589 RepID=A0A2T0X164_9RHOB|nr:CoA ester lyase [Hasllibacter halocynthiae]PRY92689.1 (3S)-malyl-CoA thioesterase [Hasllibacter halocynthiae]
MTDPAPRPVRSALFVPASSPRALAKAPGAGADAVIYDLEDAVAPAAKPAARDALAGALATPGPALRIVRVNGLGTPWHEDDLQAVRALAPDGVLIPKAEGPAAVAKARDGTGLPVWAMIETPSGVLRAPAIAAAEGLAGLVAGTNDLAAELRAEGRPAMALALQGIVLAARAAGVVALDGVCGAFRDADALRAECAEGRRLGFDGKTLIHPVQVAAANAAFGPSDEEVALARRRIEAFEAMLAQGAGVAVLDGRIVENLHVRAARRILAIAGAAG